MRHIGKGKRERIGSNVCRERGEIRSQDGKIAISRERNPYSAAQATLFCTRIELNFSLALLKLVHSRLFFAQKMLKKCPENLRSTLWHVSKRLELLDALRRVFSST